MDARKTVGVKETWVPNRYVLRLSTEDHERFAQMEGALVRELEGVVVEGARERGWGLVARPDVSLEPDPGLKRGDLRIESELTEEPGPPQPDQLAAPAGTGRGELVLEDGKRWLLDRDRSVIGRLAGSEVEISDPGASRRHAEIRREGDDYVVVDLGSTNGTLVNDSPISEVVLSDGDRITIGRTVLEFRRS